MKISESTENLSPPISQQELTQRLSKHSRFTPLVDLRSAPSVSRLQLTGTLKNPLLQAANDFKLADMEISRSGSPEDL